MKKKGKTSPASVELKASIRRDIISQRKALTQNEIFSYGSIFAERLFSLPEYQSADEVYVYASVNGEAYTSEIINIALSDGKRVALPVSVPRSSDMTFYYIKSTEDLSDGYMGIPEPAAVAERSDAAIPTEAEKALIIMPGVAFDKDRNRLGYGGGYYDKYLASYGNFFISKIALAYDFQIVGKIKAEEHDIKPDIIVTPSQILR